MLFPQTVKCIGVQALAISALAGLFILRFVRVLHTVSCYMAHPAGLEQAGLNLTAGGFPFSQAISVFTVTPN